MKHIQTGGRMKFTTKAVLLSLIILPVFSQNYDSNRRDRGQNKNSIEEKKTKILSHIDQRISLLQQSKSCVSAASSRDDLRNCREQTRTKMDALRPERNGERGQRKYSNNSQKTY